CSSRQPAQSPPGKVLFAQLNPIHARIGGAPDLLQQSSAPAMAFFLQRMAIGHVAENRFMNWRAMQGLLVARSLTSSAAAFERAARLQDDAGSSLPPSRCRARLVR